MTKNTAKGDTQASFSYHKDSLITRTLKACLDRETDYNRSVKIIPTEMLISD